MQPATRKKDIGELLSDNYRLLKEWERRQSTAIDPTDALNAQNEIKRIRKLIRQQEKERRQIKTRKKQVIILAIILSVLIIGSWLLLTYTSPEPDYAAYLAYTGKGDSLVQQNKFAEARTAYNKAAKYNPRDAALTQKLNLLDSASQFIKDKKYAEAKALFQVVVNIPASTALSPTALAKAGVTNNPPLQILITLNGASLEIRITGGVPYKNEAQPYRVEGVDCKDCIQWKKNNEGYVASVAASKVHTGNIRLSDRLGQFSDGIVPASMSSAAPNMPAQDDKKETTPPVQSTEKPTASKEETFSNYMHAGDSLFTARQYPDARNTYLSAKAIKPADAGVIKKIGACDDKILEHVKNIPRNSVAGGSFNMGTDNGNPDDGPTHPVNLTNYAMSKTEVTVAQYRDFCKYTGRQMPPEPPYGWVDDNPMVNVTWEEAAAYCDWVGGRLPTEAEWEYAAAAGSNTTYSGGNRIDQIAIYNTNSRGKAAKVAKKIPNAFGLFDMTGNVAEWCADWHGRKYYAQSSSNSPKGPASGTEKVIRGGAYNSFVNSTQDGNQLRITYRNSEAPTARQPYIGFRVAWGKT